MSPYRAVGHNIIGFDLPYLIRSSIYNGVKVPSHLTPIGSKGGKYFPSLFIDTMQLIGAGEWGYRMGLDRLAKVLGLDGKNGNGKDFYKLNRPEQEDYLENDLRVTRAVFKKLNISCNVSDERNVLYFDIETGPRSPEEIADLAPAFNPDDVKVGNLKDPAKIEEKIEEARQNHLRGYINKAGLHAEYSQPVAIGYIHPEHSHDGSIELDFSEPKELLERFWDVTGWLWGQQPEKTTL